MNIRMLYILLSLSVRKCLEKRTQIQSRKIDSMRMDRFCDRMNIRRGSRDSQFVFTPHPMSSTVLHKGSSSKGGLACYQAAAQIYGGSSFFSFFFFLNNINSTMPRTSTTTGSLMTTGLTFGSGNIGHGSVFHRAGTTCSCAINGRRVFRTMTGRDEKEKSHPHLRPLSPHLRRRLRHFLYSVLIILFLLAVSYSFFLWIGMDLSFVLGKVKSMLLTKSINFLLSRLGCCGGGLVLSLLFVLLSLLTEPATMMMQADSGPSSSNQGGPASTSQPVADAPAAPIDTEVYVPLLEDGERRRELNDRFGVNSLGLPDNLEEREEMVETHLQIEKKLEKALLSDGYSRDSLLAKRHQIRGFVFYPNGHVLSKSTYQKYLYRMNHFGTHRTVPYKRIMDAIDRLELTLQPTRIRRQREAG